MPLYEIAILEHIKKRDEKDVENIILAPKAIIASSDRAAATKAIREVENLPDDLDNVQVIVRPFA